MSEVGIDALMIKARASARELNGYLTQLKKEGVWVSVMQFPFLDQTSNIGAQRDWSQVYLAFGFEPEKDR